MSLKLQIAQSKFVVNGKDEKFGIIKYHSQDSIRVILRREKHTDAINFTYKTDDGAEIGQKSI